MGYKDGDLARIGDGDIYEVDDNGGIEFVALIDMIERDGDTALAVYYLRRSYDLMRREWAERQTFVDGAIADLRRYGNGEGS